ncbi:MAG: tetratricopeptide repeat protein [Planctomycetota bacterium]
MKAIRSLFLSALSFCLLGILIQYTVSLSESSAAVLTSIRTETDEEKALRLFREGNYDKTIELARKIDQSLGRYSVQEQWKVLILKSLMRQGKYRQAKLELDESLKALEYSIQLRLLGIEICKYNNDAVVSQMLADEIGELASRSSWRYRDPDNLITLSRYFLMLGADAKEILDKFLYPIRSKMGDNPEVHRAIADLAMQKQDFQIAAESYAEVVRILPNDPDAHSGLAKAFESSDAEKYQAELGLALKVNPNHVPSLLLQVDQLIAGEKYVIASEKLDQIEEVNSNLPELWAYRAVLAHLDNDPEKELSHRSRGLVSWPANPMVDHLIGRELSQKYRFSEGETYQRRALVLDENFLPAKIQLAHDLLRLGQELEGWKLADEVFDKDQYSVVAHNLVKLRDNMSKFKTLERDGFVVRMDAFESEIYGDRVLDLVVEASEKLCKKYSVELEFPIFIEIFPKQQDFAIRTFGLPGGSGFLGVCFGRVVTMNSPAAQGSNLTSWESVLWHEFCHVVTLQKTKNKMPRWLSEGISVYEEKLADPAWGDSMSIPYRKMITGGELTPVSQLSSAFLRPKSGQHLQFAYYESSLVVEYIVDQFGLESLLKVLDDLAIGTPINDALRRHVAPVEFLDKKFDAHAKQLADQLAADANWDIPNPEAAPELGYWKQWNQDHPDNVEGLLMLAKLLFSEKKYAEAVDALQRVIELTPELKTPYPLLARCYRELDQQDKAISALEKYARLDADSVEVFLSLLQNTSAQGDWEKTRKYARKLAGVNPLLTAPHRFLSMAAQKLGDDRSLIDALAVLSKMNPLDASDVHFRLASALNREKRYAEAKTEVVKALENAPRYRDAHQLLLTILDNIEVELEAKPEESQATQSAEKMNSAKIKNSVGPGSGLIEKQSEKSN